MTYVDFLILLGVLEAIVIFTGTRMIVRERVSADSWRKP